MNANGKELVKLLESEYPNIAGIIAMKNNQVELEYYSPGFSKLTAIHISSVTKSITSMLFGVALKQGHIGSIDQHVLDFFPDYKIIKRGEETSENNNKRHAQHDCTIQIQIRALYPSLLK